MHLQVLLNSFCTPTAHHHLLLLSTVLWILLLLLLLLLCVWPWHLVIVTEKKHKLVTRISKKGAKFSLATSAHITGGAKLSFSNFSYGERKIFLPKRGHGPMAPSKYTTACHNQPQNCICKKIFSVSLIDTRRLSQFQSYCCSRLVIIYNYQIFF